MFFVEVTAKNNSNIYTGTTTIKIVQNNLTLSQLVAQKTIGVSKVNSYDDNLNIEQITSGLQKVNFNTVDNLVTAGLKINSQTKSSDKYERTVTLGVEPNSELAEIVDVNSTISVKGYACKSGDIFVKLLGISSSYINN
jgi:hypothetical protein